MVKISRREEGEERKRKGARRADQKRPSEDQRRKEGEEKGARGGRRLG